MASPVYTNVSFASHNGVQIQNVKSVQINEELNLLESQADGARGPEAVGELENTFAITVEAEETAQDFSGDTGFANKGDFIAHIQLENDPSNKKSLTVNNVILTGSSRSTDQANPNGVSLTSRQTANDSALSIAAVV